MDTSSSRRHTRKHLPVASGPHTVGIVDIMCERGEHGSFFRLYYPTNKTDIYKRDRQWPLWLPRKQYGLGYICGYLKRPRIFGKLFNWLGGDVYVPALWQALLLQSDTPYPVIVFSHGIAGNRTTYTTMCVELASQGFVVAAVEHRDGSASMTLCLKNKHRSSLRVSNDHDHHNSDTTDSSHHHHHHHSSDHNHNHRHHDNNNSNDHHHHHHHHYFQEEWKWFEHVAKWDDFDYRNGQTYQRVAECQQVLDLLTEMNNGATLINTLGIAFDTKQFKGQLDMQRVSIVGHSFGGATCVATLAKEPRFKVGVMLDGWMHPVDDSLPPDVTQPLLMLNMESFQWRRNVEQMMVLQQNTTAPRPMITVKGTCHQSVSDFQFLCSKPVGRLMDVRYKLDAHLSVETICKATLGFLWKHFEMPNKPYHEDIISGKHPLIIPGTNVDLS